jgi:hypothetical protein
MGKDRRESEDTPRLSFAVRGDRIRKATQNNADPHNAFLQTFVTKLQPGPLTRSIDSPDM